MLRLKHISGLRSTSNLPLLVYPWSDLAGVPGNSDYLPWGNCWQPKEEMRGLADEVISHHIRVFTEHPRDVSIADPEQTALISKHCHSVDKDLLDSYAPIDWHRDFHSGYRWPPHLFFQDVKMF